MQLQRLGFVEQIRFDGDPGSRPVEVPIRHPMQATLPRRSYDHRIREAICETRDPDLFPELQIPGSTIRSWLHRGMADVETVDVLDDDRLRLLAQNRELQRRVAFLGAMVGVLVALIRVSKSRLDFERIPDPTSKRVLLRAIEFVTAALLEWEILDGCEVDRIIERELSR